MFGDVQKLNESNKDLFIRYRKQQEKEMTLIIGAVCDEGIVLIGDTKIVDPEKNTYTHEDKILMPLDFPVIVGAAGLTDLARQFNRKLPIRVDTRLKEFRLKNEAILRKVGKSLDDYEGQTQRSKQNQTQEPRKKQESKKESLEDQLPYIYNMDEFLTDCKDLIRTTSDEGRRYSLNPLEMLISFNAGNVPVLFHIDTNGFERQVIDYHAIGSGSTFVDMFFRRMWHKRSIKDTVALATFVIRFIQNLQLDNFVGTEENRLPQVMEILENGAWGYLEFKNHDEFLNSVNNLILEIEAKFKQVSFLELKELEGYEINKH